MKRIFVSSTFRDMENERDMFREKVFPILNAEARSHNDSVEFCDLRWGIDTIEMDEKSAESKILNVCLDELEHSDDLMIILLGDRYGWTLTSDQLNQLSEQRKLASMPDNLSVTALEIEYGVFTEKKKALVYIREFIYDTEDFVLPEIYFEKRSDSQKELEKLKKRLRDASNCKVQSYFVHYTAEGFTKNDLDVLADMMVKDLKEEYASEWKNFDEMSAFDREQEIQWGFIKEQEIKFAGREKEIEQVLNELQSFDETEKQKQTILYAVGQSGSGKTAFLSKIAMELRKRGRDVLPFIGGLTYESDNALSILRNIVYYMEEQLQLEHLIEFGDQPELKEQSVKSDASYRGVPEEQMIQKLQIRLSELSNIYIDGHTPLVVLIDALDQLYPDDNLKNRIFCPKEAGKNIQYLMTCTPGVEVNHRLCMFLDELHNEDKEKVMEGILTRHGKELARKVKDKILSMDNARRPLYISMVIDRLMLMNDFDYRQINANGGNIDAISNYQIELLNELPKNINDMAVVLFEKAGEKIDPVFTNKILSYISISRRGVRLSDLAYCMKDKWNPIAFSTLINYLDGQFQIHADGRIDFVHNTIRKSLLKNIKNSSELHLQLEWCYHLQPVEDPVRASEIIYHAKCRNDFDYAAEVVKSIVYNNYAKDMNVIKKTNGIYARSLAYLAVSDRGKWVNRWMEYLSSAAQKSRIDGDEKANKICNRVWETAWFIDRHLIANLPEMKAGYETAYSLLINLQEIIKKADDGTWSESDREYLSSCIMHDITTYSSKVDERQKALITAEKVFEEVKKRYEMEENPSRSLAREMFGVCYHWMWLAKGSSDGNVQRAALKVASYGISLIKTFSVDDFELSGEFFGCIGEMCGRMRNYGANMAAYEQDLYLREERYRKNKTAENLSMLSGSYTNICRVSRALEYGGYGMDPEELYPEDGIFFRDSDYPLKMFPMFTFNNGDTPTEGELFLSRCRKKPWYITAWLAAKRSIELQEEAFEKDTSGKLFIENVKEPAIDLWYLYLEAAMTYFDMRNNLTIIVDGSEFISLESEKKAIRYLLKGMDCLRKRFFYEVNLANCKLILSNSNILFKSGYHYEILTEETVRYFDEWITEEGQILKKCGAKAKNDLEDGKPAPTTYELDSGERFDENGGYVLKLLLFDCTNCIDMLRKWDCSSKYEKVISKWRAIASDYMNK